jgi:hypothetical protein
VPITIVEPPSAGPFGPGFIINVVSDFIGPLEAGGGWNYEIWTSDNETLYFLSPFVLSQEHTFVKTNAVDALTEWHWPTVYSGMVNGADAILKVTLFDPEFEVIETVSQPITLDLVSGMTYILTELLSDSLRALPTTGTDITTLEADVAEIKAASFGNFGDVAVPISHLISAPPLGFLVRELIEPDRTGEGELTREGPLGPVNAFGLAWEFVDVAPGIGVAEGAPDRLWTKALEINLVHTLADSTLVNSQTVQFNYGDTFMTFDPLLPTLVRYWIGPGVTVRFYWLLVV